MTLGFMLCTFRVHHFPSSPLIWNLRILGARVVWKGLAKGVLGKSLDSPRLILFHHESSHHLLKSFSHPLRLTLWTVLSNVLNESLLSYYCVLMEHKSSKNQHECLCMNFLWENIMQLSASSQLHGLLSFLKTVSVSTNYLVVSLNKSLKRRKKTRPQTLKSRKQISLSNDNLANAVLSAHVRYLFSKCK